jgi:hypothetical protein
MINTPEGFDARTALDIQHSSAGTLPRPAIRLN